MNTGDHLDEAAAALARATVALRDHRPHEPDEQAAVAIARTRLYEELGRQAALLAGPDALHAEFVASLRQATATVRAAMPVQLPDTQSVGPVGRAAAYAVTAIVTANTALAGHLGLSDGRPPTPEGIALRAGHGRAENLAATARLVAAAMELDTRLMDNGWLRPDPDTGSWRPLLMAAADDVNRTEHGDLAIQALRVATRGNAAEAPARRVNDNPIAGDQPWRWRLITSSRLLVDAMDAARSSLLVDGDNLTTTETARMARSALIATHHVGHILVHTTDNPDQVTRCTLYAAKQWRTAASAAGMLRSPGRQPVGGYTADTALLGVADWLSRTLGPPHTWRPVAKWPILRKDQSWQELAGQIAARLPEIALLMSEQVIRAQNSGGLLRAEALYRQPGKVLHLVQWDRAPASDPIFRQLRNSLQRAADASGELANLSGAKRPVGISDAIEALRHYGERITVREIIQGSFTTPPATNRFLPTRPTPGIRWPERRDRRR